MKKYFYCTLILAFMLGAQSTFAQKDAEKSDPKATALLNKLKKQYNSYKTVQADFMIETEVPEKPKDTKKGQLFQAGKKYRMVLPELTSFSDAKTVWTYIKKNKEIQVTNYGDKESTPFISPQELLTIYERKDHLYAISGDAVIQGKNCTEIEFKPVSSKLDYFKIRLSVDKKTMQLLQAKVFYKDGVRYTLRMTKFTPNQTLDNKYFTYRASDFPGIPVEDLRID